MELLNVVLELQAADETSAHYGPAMKSLDEGDAPTVLFVPLARLGGVAKPSITVTISAD